ncbi:MAG: hypothetical protein KF782_25610 [Labilithrix sp.]|nr:hypothetical protein [Labilithrix sp.]
MRSRGVICSVMLAASAIACGLSVIGAEPDAVDEARDAEPERGVDRPDADPLDPDAPPPPPPPVLDPFDGGVDASPENCAIACADAGTCVAGWCVITCNGGAECRNGAVTCPPGVPCDVRCNGADACKDGVDCADATACSVLCDGRTSCTNDKVRCKGAACRVTCSQKDACLQGVACDAGVCAIRCLGNDACKNERVVCNADRCSVECGASPKEGNNACQAGVDCQAATSCDVRCLSDNSCKNAAVVAVASDTVAVTCSGMNSCEGVVASAGDSGVQCLGQNACKNGVSCDGGRCAARCEKSDIELCCEAGVCATTTGACQIEPSCP